MDPIEHLIPPPELPAGTRISLVMPCHDEEEGLREMLPWVPSWIDEVIVVDNRSTDGSVEVARAYGAKVVTEDRLGYGAAYKAGFAEATTELVATMDADGTYPLDALPEMIDRLLAEDLDFVSGRRFPLVHGSAMPLTNKIGNWVLTITSRLLFGVGLRDSQSGMWLFRRSVLDAIGLESDGMALSQEIKLRTIFAGHAFAEHHIAYEDRIGTVKLNAWRDGISNLVSLVTLRLSLLGARKRKSR